MKLVIQNVSHVFGGNEKWLATLAEGLSARGHCVTVSCAPGPVSRELESRGVAVSSIRPRGGADVVSGVAFARWLRKERPDALLLTSWRTTGWSFFAGRAAGVERIVARLGIVRERPSIGPRAWALTRLDALIVNSAEIERVWQASGRAGPKVHVVMNGVRPRMHERESLRRALRDEIGARESTILIGGAGHIAARKGFDVLLRAFRDAQVDDSHLVLIGDGADRGRLELLAAELGIAARTSFLGHRDDGAGAIAGLDLFVLSSHNEGMANVMLEAMAGGTPVVAASISGVERALASTNERPQAGWIVPSVNPGAFAEAIRAASRSIRDGSQEARAITAEAEWRAVNWFGTERMVSECETILFPRR